ncbi:unnamed protein product [Heterosigma akashiwo]
MASQESWYSFLTEEEWMGLGVACFMMFMILAPSIFFRVRIPDESEFKTKKSN